MLMAKTDINAIVIFDAFWFVELLHKFVWQHVVVITTPSKVTLLAVHDAAHNEMEGPI